MIYLLRPVLPKSFDEAPLRRQRQTEINKLVKQKVQNLPDENIVKRHHYIPGFIAELSSCFKHKCAFCELPLANNQGKILFFRPRLNTEPALHGEWQPTIHYYWLSWHWPNIYLSCDECQHNKGFAFPIDARRRASPGIYDAGLLLKEKPLLLDPCHDNPLFHLEFKSDGSLQPRRNSRRGKQTINTFDLNRETLRRLREEEYISLADKWDIAMHARGTILSDAIDELLALCGSDHKFAGLKRQFVYNWLASMTRKLSNNKVSVVDKVAWHRLQIEAERWMSRPIKITPQLSPTINSDLEPPEVHNQDEHELLNKLLQSRTQSEIENSQLKGGEFEAINEVDIRFQQEQLSSHRHNLRYFLRQSTNFGGEKQAPIEIFNSIREQRERIADIKGILRAWGVEVVDYPEDGE